MAETKLNHVVSSEQSDKPTGFDRFTLTVQFLIAGSVVLLFGMLAIGNWVTLEIENGVIRNKAASTALYIESFVAPRVQELATSNRVLPKTKSELDRVFSSGDLRTRFITFKIWMKDGLLAYSSRPQMIGKQFPITDELMRSWAGDVTAEFDSLGDEEDALERAQGVPLLEIYSPIREPSTGRVIAVAEFYETAAALQKNLLWAKVKSWLAVAGASLLMMLALSGIVIRGSRTIERQRALVQERVEELSNLLQQNETLRTRLQVMSNRVAESNERNLNRIGSNLHDGPAQFISLALLRLDSLKLAVRKLDPDVGDPEEIVSIREALKHAISEIRELSAGLTLAKLEDMSPLMVLQEIVSAHEIKTECTVILTVESIPEILPLPLKISMFRFVQEALNNTSRQYGSIEQIVNCRFNDGQLELEVVDSGAGFKLGEDTITDIDSEPSLIVLRDRIESLGATLQINSNPGKGAQLTMRCQVG